MRKTITLVLFATALLFGYIGFAQENKQSQANRTWPEPGAKWTYCVSGYYDRPGGEEKWALSGDTLINGRSWSMIKRDNQTEGQPSSILSNDHVFYSRFSNDSIYRFVNNKEYLLFTYNLNVGDVLTTFRAAGVFNWQDSACSSRLPLKVIEKSEVMLGSSLLQKFVLEDTLFGHLYPNYIGEPIRYTFIERIGVINNYPFMNSLEMPTNCELFVEPESFTIGKYSDDSFEHIYGECPGVGLKESESYGKSLRIYPNPANNWVSFTYTLEGEHAQAVLEIRDASGKTVHQVQLSQPKGAYLWDTRELQSGTYYYSLKTANTNKNGKVVISK